MGEGPYGIEHKPVDKTLKDLKCTHTNVYLQRLGKVHSTATAQLTLDRLRGLAQSFHSPVNNSLHQSRSLAMF
jgi:hypothetical protein